MARNLFFIQPCSTCGRRLQVRVVDLGKALLCQHCGAELTAEDPDSRVPEKLTTSKFDPVDLWIEAAEEVLVDESPL